MSHISFFDHRHPHHSKRPGFEEILRSLLDNEQTVLHIPSEDAATHKQAACLGAELQAGHKMYSQLQALYIPSNASISQRPQCASINLVKYTSDRRGDYESIETDEDTRSYLNIDHNSLAKPAGEKEDEEAQRYGNINRETQAVVEAIYDRVTHENSTAGNEICSGKNSEEYYNVVAAAVIEDHIPQPRAISSLHSSAAESSTRRDPSPPPLGPKPTVHSPEQTPTIPLHELVDGDYYETGVSIFTSNNDHVMV